MTSRGGNSALQPWQFGLAHLFVLTLAAAVLLWAWRFGPAKLAGIIALITGAVLSLVWIALLAQRLFWRN